jgi:hypothetical protein
LNALEQAWFGAVASLECCVLCGRYGVQVSHSNIDRGKGQKSSPDLTAALCPKCHGDIDNGKDLVQLERRWLHARAINLTHHQLFERGILLPPKLKRAA